MKTNILIAVAIVVLGTGCASFTKGVETARGAVLGAIDSVRVGVDKSFAVVVKGAETAQKIAGDSLEGAKSVTEPVTTTQ